MSTQPYADDDPRLVEWDRTQGFRAPEGGFFLILNAAMVLAFFGFLAGIYALFS